MASKQVISERNRRQHAANRERNSIRHAALRVARKAGPDAQDWAMKKLLGDARRRAQSKGLPFTLELSTVARPTHCPVLGLELVYQATGMRQSGSASLDRFDSTKGYTPENVWIISWRANQIKSDSTLAELQALCAAVEKKAAGRLLDGIEHNGFPS